MVDDEIRQPIQPSANPEPNHPRGLTILFVIALCLIGVQTHFCLFAMPGFVAMFKEMDFGELPQPTLLLIAISRFGLIVTAILLVATILSKWKKRRMGLILVCGTILICGAYASVALFMPLVTTVGRLSNNKG